MNPLLAIRAVPLVKGAICVAWLLLFALLLHRDFLVGTINSRESTVLEQARHTEYWTPSSLRPTSLNSSPYTSSVIASRYGRGCITCQLSRRGSVLPPEPIQ